MRINISTTIKAEDHQYCKANNLMISRLLENAISIHRQAKELGEEHDHLNYQKRLKEKLQAQNAKFISFLQDKQLLDEFSKEMMQ